MENQFNYRVSSDSKILEKIAFFIRDTRIQQHKTQEELALASGVSRRTLTAFESGKNNIQLLSLIQLLRALDCLDVFSNFHIIQSISPLLMAKEEQAKIKRVRHTTPPIQKPKSTW